MCNFDEELNKTMLNDLFRRLNRLGALYDNHMHVSAPVAQNAAGESYVSKFTGSPLKVNKVETHENWGGRLMHDHQFNPALKRLTKANSIWRGDVGRGTWQKQ